ncbi:uncharacterized protein LOC126969582 [Leptidea sinapis]|uniref:uncharacterized protein LOC126969582 n=1 Tax=Leptidea sinapis TaxID=189913 RepID=UPI00214020E5|nr:uncharacterized protein LOC126969582 [Leptidea sinapis]
MLCSNMFMNFKITLLLLIGYSSINQCLGDHGEFLDKEDQSYSIINFQVPRDVWIQAFEPKTVLKSPVTIVVPIQVADNDENEVNIEEEDEVSDITTPVEIFEEPVSQEPIISSTPSIVTQKPTTVQDQPIAPTGGVNGTVIRFPCTCLSGQCGCCTGAILERFKMKTCGNITFVPEDFVFDVRLSVNNKTVVRTRVSASNPPPICINPRRAPFVRVCAEISNIRIRNGNAFACLDINADIAGFPVYSASFRCFGFGSSGVQTGLKPKPVSSGPKPINLFGSGSNNNGGGSVLETAGAILGGNRRPSGGIFSGGSGGPLDAIGGAIGGLFDGRNLN